MERILLAIAVLTLFLASCNRKEESHYECDYYAMIDSITYTEQSDSAKYDKPLREALSGIGFTETLFKEKADADINSIDYVRLQCDQKAVNTFSTKCLSVRRTLVLQKMETKHPDLAPVVLGDLTVYMSLYSAQYTIPIKEGFKLYL